ncbi:MAG: DUF3788 domain-containing protein [Bacteroidetes bacterium]|nr:DUF3788 domain-containing protein [Bacteroidota bacterium]
MDISIFTDKKTKPDEASLKAALGRTFRLWVELENYVLSKYPAAVKEWNFPGEKYGWSYKLKDKKRTIVYLLPRGGFFKAAFVFGEKAFVDIIESGIGRKIKEELKAACPYAEGRGIRIDIKNPADLKDTLKLVDIKLSK